MIIYDWFGIIENCPDIFKEDIEELYKINNDIDGDVFDCEPRNPSLAIEEKEFTAIEARGKIEKIMIRYSGLFTEIERSNNEEYKKKLEKLLDIFGIIKTIFEYIETSRESWDNKGRYLSLMNAIIEVIDGVYTSLRNTVKRYKKEDFIHALLDESITIFEQIGKKERLPLKWRKELHGFGGPEKETPSWATEKEEKKKEKKIDLKKLEKIEKNV